MATRRHTTLGVVHVTATPPGWANRVPGIRAIHKTQDWSDIGCNDIINPNGRADMGRGRMTIGAHVAGFNSISYGLSMVGGVDVKNRPDFNTIKVAELATLATRMRELSAEFFRHQVVRRPDLPSDKNGNGITEPFEHIKACPCFDVVLWERERGLPVDDTKGTLKTVVLELESAPGARRSRYPYGHPHRLLTRGGYVIGPLGPIDGKKTTAAMGAFQLTSNLTQSGGLDFTTVARLRAVLRIGRRSGGRRNPSLERNGEEEPGHRAPAIDE